MLKIKELPVLLVLAGALCLGMACAAPALLPDAGAAFPAIPPTPSSHGTPTGSSPMSGDWDARPEFGRFAFSVDPDGKNVTTAVVELSNYTCGGTTLTTEVQILNTWPISNGQFTGSVDLNPGHIEDLSFSGAYDEARRSFSGTWEEDAYGTHCSGTWKTPARK